MLLKRSSPRKILVVSLSNIGDVVLTLPMVDALRVLFPQAQISLVIGPKAESLFEGHPSFHHVEIYDKHIDLMQKYQWIRKLKAEGFDAVVDLRNTIIPLLLGSRYRMPLWQSRQQLKKMHRKSGYFSLLRTMWPVTEKRYPRFAVYISSEIEEKMRNQRAQFIKEFPFVIMAPGAAALEKRWSISEFTALAGLIQSEFQRAIVLVGHESDLDLSRKIEANLSGMTWNLTGQTSLVELAEILQHAELAVVNDSGPMHLASYMNCPTLAMFGPTDPLLYGPWSDQKVCLDRMESRTHQDVLNCLCFEDARLGLKL